MKGRQRSAPLDYRKKNRRKAFRTVVQAGVLLVLAGVLVNALWGFETYQPPDTGQWSNREGFIALSYFGVARRETGTLISRERLEDHLKALKENGFQTLSQQHVIDFYGQQAPLPGRGFFLSFEDGRNDSALFVQPLLEANQFQATMLTYANKMGNPEGKFLQPRQLLEMTKRGFWELGTNGYRLSYINIYDRNGSFVGNQEPDTFLNKGLARSYDHYLMDFIRDEQGVPAENRSEMEARIQADYEAMALVYTRTLGQVPPVYMIMHANSLYINMNRLVADANDRHIRSLFQIHFNREGVSFNDGGRSPYDLTRVQPAPYWYANHLLMKIQEDTGLGLHFIQGDEERAQEWVLASGAGEWRENQIVLTSLPGAEGRLFLKNSDFGQDLALSCVLAGNVVGSQSLYLAYQGPGTSSTKNSTSSSDLPDNQDTSTGADPLEETYLSVTLLDNRLLVAEKSGAGEEKLLYSKKLDPLPWQYDTVPRGKAVVNQVDSRNPDIQAASREIPISRQQDYSLNLHFIPGELILWLEGNLLATVKTSLSPQAGSFGLGARASERNQKETIYDGVFQDLKLTGLPAGEPDSKKEQVLFDNGYRGWERLLVPLRKSWNRLIDWAIDTF